MADPFLSEIRIFSFGFAPKGWAVCNGQLLPINQNAALFSLMGSVFGGDGRTNFALPDMRGRIPACMGPNFSLGQGGGHSDHKITQMEMPIHTHLVNARTSSSGRSTSPKDNFPADTSPNSMYNDTCYAANTDPKNQDPLFATSNITSCGGNQPHTNMQPYLSMNFCIAIYGILPKQN